MPFLDSGFRPVESFQERSRIIDSAVPEREHVGIVVVDNYLRYFAVLQQTQSDTGTPGIGFDIRDVTNAENIDKRGDVPGQPGYLNGEATSWLETRGTDKLPVSATVSIDGISFSGLVLTT